MFYGSGAGKLPTASAVVADIVDMVKHTGTNIFINWSQEKMDLVDYQENTNTFFVRTTSDKADVEAAFGAVEYIEGIVDGEIAFITSSMTEAEFAEKIQQTSCVNRIRLA
jgi:homoserine dehydrogenase